MRLSHYLDMTQDVRLNQFVGVEIGLSRRMVSITSSMASSMS